MGITKYEYKPSGVVPSIVLKKGVEGVIHEVSLYKFNDFLRGEGGINNNIASLEGFGLGDYHRGKVATLEECNDRDLKELVYSASYGSKGEKLPLEELQEIRDLEIELRQSIGGYREG